MSQPANENDRAPERETTPESTPESTPDPETPEEARRRRAAAWGRVVPSFPKRGAVRIKESVPPEGRRATDTLPPTTLRIQR